ncbi:hypothetical protein ACFP63_16945 [Oerskovia jenensis]|uniref:YdhG-like domain-containing protein n=1 Tax=Oerskovia jenensis TaxID=162169 RepID=A0ABS2LG58_9CELL|nr:hypothetical protein [Oerskovia jenensis]MBM7479409.1 hypothetical protein [Oerskovia jenensis]
MQKTGTDPDEYLTTLPERFRDDALRLDAAISEVMAGRSRVLWEGVFWGGTDQRIIGYGDVLQARPRGGSVEWFAVGLAVQQNYLSVYVNAVEDDQYVAQKYAHTLGRAKIGSSSVSFKSLADIDLDAVLHLVRIAREQTA